MRAPPHDIWTKKELLGDLDETSKGAIEISNHLEDMEFYSKL